MYQKKAILAVIAIASVLAAASCASSSTPASTPSSTYTLEPIGAECPLPESLDNQGLLDQVATVEIGEAPAEVSEKVEAPDNPLTAYNVPNRNLSVMSWVRDEGDGEMMEIRVEFEDDKVIQRVLGIGSTTGDICSWSIED